MQKPKSDHSARVYLLKTPSITQFLTQNFESPLNAPVVVCSLKAQVRQAGCQKPGSRTWGHFLDFAGVSAYPFPRVKKKQFSGKTVAEQDEGDSKTKRPIR